MLSAAELRLVSRLDLAYRQPLSGAHAGGRRSRRAARSPEFSDFRAYVPGDDYRQIDWRAFARLERLILRLFVGEEEACLNIVLDSSASMGLGEPPKWAGVCKLAAAIAVMGLSRMDRVQVGLFSGRHVGPLRGRHGLSRAIAFLNSVKPFGVVNPDQLVRLHWLRPGLTIILSDFLIENAEWAGALAMLRAGRQETILWQVLAANEESPTLIGDVLLIDTETERTLEITITPELVRRYRLALTQHRHVLASSARAVEGSFVHSISSEDLAVPIRAGLQAGVIRRG